MDRPTELQLTLENNTSPGNRYVVGPGGGVIGRDHERADIVIGDALVSRVHARIDRTHEGWTISNLTDGNQVYVNGTEVRRSVIHDGDLLRLGGSDLRVKVVKR
jgi:pSer/pThr/pTyr-binding forkhead associated (FHA) protein